MIQIRPFQPEHFDLLLALADQAVPFAPDENAEWLAYRKAFDESTRLRRHYLAWEGEIPVGYGCLEQQGDDTQTLRIYVVCSPERLNGEVGDALYDRLKLDVEELNITKLWARELQADEPISQFFTGKGFEVTERVTPPNFAPVVVFEQEV
jgi:hypothetical protein